MMPRKALPHPLLTVTLTAVWVLLLNDFSLSSIVLGLIVGITIPLMTSAYWLGHVRLRAPFTMIEYALVVLWDIVVSNIQVAYLVLFRRGNSLRSRFITIPLDIASPEGIAVLAGTITMTPGTLSADVSADQRALLVHCLDTADPDETITTIKNRYERRLMRIFA
jgi:multicomponent K+:H+ antiporter subunit E